jgi:hypothetical protein
VSKETPICPVCGDTLKATGVDPNMYYCTKRKIWFPDIGAHLDTIEATIYVDDDGKYTLQVIEVPPYRFTITDNAKVQKTEVEKVVKHEPAPGHKWYPRALGRKVILTIPSIMNLPWNDKEKVLERMKLFLLFS